MADLIIPGLPLTLSTFDLRMRADKLLLAGHEEEGRLLHALLDFATRAQVPETERREQASDTEEELREAERRVEGLETRLSQISEMAVEAGERMELALGALMRNEHPEAMRLLAEAVGLLVNVTQEMPEES